MVLAGEVRAGELVVEVGPGKGILTNALLEAGARVIALEKDDRLIGYLEEKFAEEIENGKLRVIHDDALKFTAPDDKLPVTSYKIVANIPYYITGALIRKFLTEKHQPSQIALLVQKEVAERIAARDGKESILSISVKAYGKPKVVKIVKAGNFSPVPKVDSAILAIKNISREIFEGQRGSEGEQKFFELVKLGFAQKRKLLSSNLSTSLEGEIERGWDKNKISEAFEKCAITNKTRAENLTLEQWVCLSGTG